MASVPDDYCELLGVDSTIKEAELRRAWRRIVLRWHADRAGTETTAIFQKFVAAYTVLSDPVARAAYDRTRRPMRVSGNASAAETTRSRAALRRRAPRVLLDRVSGPLESLLACGVARRSAPDVIELHLDDVESTQGGIVTVSMNVEVRCPACTKQESAIPCIPCGGTGKVQERFSAWLTVPPSVTDGTILTSSVSLPGMIARPTFRIRSGQ